MLRPFANATRGSATIEFTLIGIPLIFVLISIFEMSRGMWLYHTLAYAAKEGTRYAIVHGADCATTPNQCTATIQAIAQRIQNAGAGLDEASLSVTVTNAAVGSSTALSTKTDSLQNMLTKPAYQTTWPAQPGSDAGNDIAITLVYPFRSAIAMFWPGAGHSSVGATKFVATAREMIQW